MSEEPKLSRERKFYADLAQMPSLSHGQDDGDETALVKAFDPEQSEVVKWIRANTDQATLVNIFLWTILKPLKVVRWDSAAKAWRMRTVAEYEKFKGDKKARREAKVEKNAALNEQREIAKGAVAVPAKPRGKPKKFPDNLLTDAIISFHESRGHWPTTGELWKAVSEKDPKVMDGTYLRDDEDKPVDIKESLFYARLAWGKAQLEGLDRIMVGDWSGRNQSELKIDTSAPAIFKAPRVQPATEPKQEANGRPPKPHPRAIWDEKHGWGIPT